jgi:hypothetical protein
MGKDSMVWHLPCGQKKRILRRAMDERSMATMTQTPLRRRKPLDSGPGKSASTTPKPRPSVTANLIKGQIWKVKDTYVQIVDAGKTLIHYTMSPKPRQRGLRVHMATRETVQDFLKSNRAKLVTE